MKTLLIYVLLITVFSGCTTSIKTTNETPGRVKSHKVIAVLPFEVRFDLRNKNRKQFKEKELAEVRHSMALGLQKQLYGWLKSYSYQKSFTVSIQHVDITDSILTANKISFFELYNMGRTELTKMLQVDAVLTPNVIFAQPNNETVAWLLNPVGALPWEKLATQEMRMQVLLNDKYSENSLWTFETKTRNGNFTKSSTSNIKDNILYPLFENIDKTFKKFIKKFPYKKKG